MKAAGGSGTVRHAEDVCREADSKPTCLTRTIEVPKLHAHRVRRIERSAWPEGPEPASLGDLPEAG